MANRKKVWMAGVDPRLPDDPKFLRFARKMREEVMKLENLHEHAAFGVLVRLWCVTMRDDDTGNLGPAPEELAERVKWLGPAPEALIQGLLDAGKTSVDQDKPGFIERTPDGFRVYKWAEYQNDPAGKREKWAEAKRKHRGGGSPTPPAAAAAPEEPPAEIGPKDECVRQILKAMAQAHITGHPKQKAEYARAWIERPGIKGSDVLELLMHPDARTMSVLWLNDRLGGKGKKKAAPTPSTLSDLTDAIHKKFGGGA